MLLTFQPLIQAIESYFCTVLNSCDATGKIFQLSHYITGVILRGKREQMARQGLRKVSERVTKVFWLNIYPITIAWIVINFVIFATQVNFEDYNGVITFVNTGNVHWKFVVSENTMIFIYTNVQICSVLHLKKPGIVYIVYIWLSLCLGMSLIHTVFFYLSSICMLYHKPFLLLTLNLALMKWKKQKRRVTDLGRSLLL